MKTTGLCLTTCLIALLFACNQTQKESKENLTTAKTASEGNGILSSSAAVENAKDTTHQFIRTADLKFKVENVIRSTYAIERITGQFDGFVTYTHLSSDVNHQTVIPVSADSSLETIYYTVINEMVLRVPNTQLDTTLKSIATLINYLDHRTIKADDVALQLLSNKLRQERVSKNEKRLTRAIDNRNHKLKETMNAEDLLMNKQEQSDQSKISNLSLHDQISFSTVTLAIYQRQALKRELVSNDKNISSFKPPLGSRITDAFKEGWEVMESIIVFMAQIWWLLVMIGFGYLLYRIYQKKSLV